ncbi:tRNA 2-selenouridine(34) synthase MnmH [Natroniella sulfidigena]|uniref:tRNA 2-selenouridine(34) synthase MnmH n=1 Tax=Natroniella sulfidigena TaxID=723921 RepID=UPI00200A2538|nr:tRNA 2-selenouridine(34) synthase MnmH [Natroniella sulfidigena]MCK8815783.1 tRNA 2-selenouridine(34) synthase MnmH [Natroniella sulfidigena]
MELITYQEVLEQESIGFIDVRTPDEFKEATIPGAVNIPIFNNQERANIGNIYTQKSPAQAKMLAVELVAPKIPKLLKKIKPLTEEYENTIIFCARGGLRSESISLFCELIGLSVYKLKGGYKSYRRFILDQLENYKLTSKLLVIHGFTGVGKTELLYRLQDSGLPIIDLEKLANHRGSAFGSIGLGQPTNQKQFDSLLWEELEKLSEAPLIAIESESRRIGISVLPDFLLESMENGIHILVKCSLESRVEQILTEYSASYTEEKTAFIDRTLESISVVKKHLIKKIGKKGYQKLINHCQRGELEEVVKILLRKYYDPLYKYSQEQINDFSLIIEDDNLENITNQLINFTTELELN